MDLLVIGTICLLAFAVNPSAGALNAAFKAAVDNNFESGWGSYKNAARNPSQDIDGKWERLKECTPTPDTGPCTGADGTTWFLAFRASTVKYDGPVLYLNYAPVTLTGPACLRFYYHKWGRGSAEMSVLNNGNVIFARRRVNLGNKWHLAEIQLTGLVKNLQFKAKDYTTAPAADAGLDQISITDGYCSPNVYVTWQVESKTVSETVGVLKLGLEIQGDPSIMDTLNRTFKVSTWNEPDQFAAKPGEDYVQLSNKEVTFATGVTSTTVDLEIVDDDFLEFDNRLKVKLTDVPSPWAIAGLTEMNIKITDDDKVSFTLRTETLWANEDDGGVRLYIAVDGNNRDRLSYKLGYTDISTTPSGPQADYKRILTGNNRITGGRGLRVWRPTIPIVVDNTVEANETFKVRVTWLYPTSIIRNGSLTTTVNIVNDDPDFETGLGAWPFVAPWTRTHTCTPTPNTGPCSGAKNTKIFIYYKAAGQSNGHSSTIVYPQPETYSGTTCLQLYYHMYGANISSLEVSNKGSPILQKNGNQGDRWHVFNYELTSIAQLSITASRGDGDYGDIGIDQISMAGGLCTPKVRFEQTSLNIGEGASVVRIRLSIEKVYTDPARPERRRFFVNTTDVSAEEGSDFTGISGEYEFPLNEKYMDIEVNITEDDLMESNEVFKVTLYPLDDGATISDNDQATVTITDDDVVTMGFPNNSITVSEDQVNATVCLKIIEGGGVGQSLTFTIDSQAGTASSPTKFALVSSKAVVYPPGVRMHCFVATTIVNNDITENDKDFLLKLTTASGVNLNITTLRVTIIDEDTPIINFHSMEYREMENNSFADLVAIQLSMPTEIPLSFRLYSNDSTATSQGDKKDFNAVNETITITPGKQTHNVKSLTISKDDSLEIDESLSLTIEPISARLQTGENATTTVLIKTTTKVLVVTLDHASITVSENNSMVVVPVTMSGRTNIPVNYNVSTSDSSTEGRKDFEEKQNATYTFEPTDAWSTTKNVTLDIKNENIVERMETFQLSITSNQDSVIMGAITTTTINIVNDDKAIIGFANTSYSVFEDSGFAKFCLDKEKPTEADLYITINTSNGTAESPNDFTAITNLNVTFPANLKVLCMNVTLDTNKIVEYDEVFYLHLSTHDPAVIIRPGRNVSTVTIKDDDIGELSFSSGTYQIIESGSEILVTANLSLVTERPLAFRIFTQDLTTTANGAYRDYVPVNRRRGFQPGGTRQLRTSLLIVDDDRLEYNETLNITIVSLTHKMRVVSPYVSLVTINNDEHVTLTIDKAGFTVSEERSKFLIPITMTGKTDIVVNYMMTTTDISSEGKPDYHQKNDTLYTFVPTLANKTTNYIKLNISNEELVERTDYLVVAIRSEQIDVKMGSISETTIGILNEDQAIIGFINTTLSVLEGSGYVTFCLDKEKPTETDLYITINTDNGTAQAPNDFTAITNLNVTFPFNLKVLCMNVTLDTDQIVEYDEVFYLHLSTQDPAVIVRPGRNVSTVTIRDDDIGEIALDSRAYELIENGGHIPMHVNLSLVTEIPLTFRMFTSDMTTIANGTYRDYVPIDRNITFQPGGTLHFPFNLTIIEDDRLEYNETLNITIVSLTHKMRVVSPNVSLVTINNDEHVTLTIDSASFEVSEERSKFLIPITMTGKTDIIVHYMMTTKDISSEGKPDYHIKNNTPYTFVPTLANRTTNYITLNISNEELVERTDHLDVSIRSVQRDVKLGNISKTTIHILNEDQAIIGFVHESLSVLEGKGYVEFCIDKEKPTEADLYITLDTMNGTAYSPNDYTALTSFNITFPHNVSLLCFNVTIDKDNITEDDEMFYLQLTEHDPGVTLRPGKERLTVTILNDDHVVVEFVGNQSWVMNEGESINLTLAITKGILGIPCTIDLIANNETGRITTDLGDFSAITNISFAPFTTSVDAEPAVNITKDEVAEGNEVMTLLISSKDHRIKIGNFKEKIIQIDDTADRVVQAARRADKQKKREFIKSMHTLSKYAVGVAGAATLTTCFMAGFIVKAIL